MTSVSSNFQHFSEAAAEQLISSGLDILILSIDGASQESYEKYRIGGNFRNVIDHISLLVKKKRERGSTTPYICWQFLVMKHNEHEVETAKKMAEELGVDSVTIDHAYLPVGTKEEAMKWLPRNPHYHRYDLAELERGWQAVEKAQDPAVISGNQQAADETGGPERRFSRAEHFSPQSELLLALDADNDKLGREREPLLCGV